MRFVDLSNSSSMTRLIELTRALSNCETPYDALLKYSGYLGDTFPDRAQLVLSTRGLPPGQYRVWRLLDDSGREHAELTDPWTNLIAPVLSGGVLAQIIRN